MKYIQATPNPSGAYPAPQSKPAEGLVAISDAQANLLVENKGFVHLTVENGVGANVEANSEGLAAWETWLAKQPHPEPDVELSVWDELDAAYREGVDSV